MGMTGSCLGARDINAWAPAPAPALILATGGRNQAASTGNAAIRAQA